MISLLCDCCYCDYHTLQFQQKVFNAPINLGVAGVNPSVYPVGYVMPTGDFTGGDVSSYFEYFVREAYCFIWQSDIYYKTKPFPYLDNSDLYSDTGIKIDLGYSVSWQFSMVTSTSSYGSHVDVCAFPIETWFRMVKDA